MIWQQYSNSFKAYLQLEKGLSAHSVEAYISDLTKFTGFFTSEEHRKNPESISLSDLQEYIAFINECGLSDKTQARMISSLKAFFRFLRLEGIITDDPALLLEAPKLSRKLPDTLSEDEIEKIIEQIDLSTNEGHRNRAIIEVLYGCGLRVSELINLRISGLYFDEGFIRIIGKGNKERLVPIGGQAIHQTQIYLKNYRNKTSIKKGNEDIVFLNRRGAALTRVMIFTIVKQLVSQANINKNISPHSFRHSFATHLIEHGADLRVVQEMLGHASITTTEIYTHIDRSHLRKALNKYHPREQKNIES